MYSFRMSFWTVPESLRRSAPWRSRDQHVEAQQNRRGGIDGHRRGDVGQPNAIEEPLHVGERADGDAHASHFAGRQRMVGIHAHLRRQIEGDREPGDALRQQIAIAAVALFGGSEAGVLAHGPEPAAVHVRIDAAGEGVLAGQFAGRAHDGS